jgi:hypothetical protein
MNLSSFSLVLAKRNLSHDILGTAVVAAAAAAAAALADSFSSPIAAWSE